MNRNSLVLLAIVLLKSAAAQAYSCIEWAPGKCTYWASRRATMTSALGTANTVFINGTTTWDQNTEGAANEWNSVGAIQFSVNTALTFPDPCGAKDGRNHMCTNTGPQGSNPIFFSRTFCGQGYGDAIELTNNCWDSGSGQMLNAPVFVNLNASWNAYDGPLKKSGAVPIYDIRRVLLHELGHVLGLDHSSTGKIMYFQISDVDRLQADDINGARAIYSSIPLQPAGSLTGTSGCELQPAGGSDGLSLWILGGVFLTGWRRFGRNHRVARISRKS